MEDWITRRVEKGCTDFEEQTENKKYAEETHAAG
jgi:hypothetical protein